MGVAAGFLGVALVCGVFLYQARGWPIVAIGLPSLFLAYGYTGGPFPLAYRGHGRVVRDPVFRADRGGGHGVHPDRAMAARGVFVRQRRSACSRRC